MVSQRCFTIIELLVAITITVLAVNLLSRLYVRATNLAIVQTEVQANTREGMAGMELLQEEFRNLIVPIAKEWDSNSAGDIQVPIYIGDIIVDGGTDAYPGIIFHRQSTVFETETTSTLMGIEQVLLFVAPPPDNFSNSPYMNLYRVVNSNYSETSDDFGLTKLLDGPSTVNPNEISEANYASRDTILENIVGISFDAKIYDPSSDDYIHISDFDPVELAREESHNIEAIRVTMTIAPPSHPIKIRRLGSGSLEGNGIDIDDFQLESGFFFQMEGFIGDLSTGEVFQYRRPDNSDDEVDITKVMDNACSSRGNGLVTGFSFQRYFSIR